MASLKALALAALVLLVGLTLEGCQRPGTAVDQQQGEDERGAGSEGTEPGQDGKEAEGGGSKKEKKEEKKKEEKKEEEKKEEEKKEEGKKEEAKKACDEKACKEGHKKACKKECKEEPKKEEKKEERKAEEKEEAEKEAKKEKRKEEKQEERKEEKKKEKKKEEEKEQEKEKAKGEDKDGKKDGKKETKKERKEEEKEKAKDRVSVSGLPCLHKWKAVWFDGEKGKCRDTCCYHLNRDTGTTTVQSYCVVERPSGRYALEACAPEGSAEAEGLLLSEVSAAAPGSAAWRPGALPAAALAGGMGLLVVAAVLAALHAARPLLRRPRDRAREPLLPASSCAVAAAGP